MSIPSPAVRLCTQGWDAVERLLQLVSDQFDMKIAGYCGLIRLHIWQNQDTVLIVKVDLFDLKVLGQTILLCSIYHQYVQC